MKKLLIKFCYYWVKYVPTFIRINVELPGIHIDSRTMYKDLCCRSYTYSAFYIRFLKWTIDLDIGEYLPEYKKHSYFVHDTKIGTAAEKINKGDLVAFNDFGKLVKTKKDEKQ